MSKEKEKTEKAVAREEARAAKAAEQKAAKAAKAAEQEAARAAKEQAKADKEAAMAAKAQARADKAAARKEKQAGDKQPGRGRKLVRALVLTAVVVLFLAAACTAALAVAGRNIQKSDKILPGVTVGEIPVGRLTQEEAVAALEVRGWEESVGGTLNVTLPMDAGCQIDYLQAGVSLNAERAAAAAYRYGRQGSVLDGIRAYFYGTKHSVDVSQDGLALDRDYIMQRLQDGIDQFDRAAADQGHLIDKESSSITMLKGAGQMKIDAEDLCAAVVAALEARETELNYQPTQTEVSMPDFEEMHAQLFTEMRNARYDPETDTIEPEVVGVDFDVELARSLWEAAAPGEEFTFPVVLSYPPVTEASMRELLFRDCLGERTTSFWGSSSNRINNIELVAQKLNGLVIQPGEEFSYNGYVGERTVEAGFKAADAYVNGGVEPQIGGGICQVSSTLYCAVLAAQLEIVDRSAHMFAVGYLPKGLDATVSWPGPDFKFRNSRDYPIRIAARVDRDTTNLTIEIWGSNLDGTYGVPKSSWGKHLDAEWLAKGYEVQVGWDAYSWVEIYAADGTYLDKIKGYSSRYDLHPEDIQWPELPAEVPPAADPSEPEITIVVPEPEPEPPSPGGGEGGGE
ncbi:MAG: VanW family protein, partial [Oscillospiraceae bacterium]|nr:VanW family protein [Oscillospiraceae bacterium]